MQTASSILHSRIHQKPLYITVGVHVLLFLFLLLWRYSKPQPVINLPELGMEVNLGTTSDGSGTDQPMNTEDPAASAISLANSSAATASQLSPDYERSIDNSGVALPSEAKTQHKSRENAANKTTQNGANGSVANQSRQRNPRYVYTGSNGTGGNGAQTNQAGTSEGNTSGHGDRGVPYGTPGANNYEGTPGSGTGGISADLDRRNIIAFPPDEAKFREGGKVVVRITVNRAGVIVNKQIVSSTNTELSPIALRKLDAVRFNKSDAAPPEQFGKITFVFKTRR